MPPPTFLTLPPKIRNMIYRMTASTQMTSLEITQGVPAITLDPGEPSYIQIPGQLLRVCRQVNEDTTPLLYSPLRIWAYDLVEASDFITTIGARNASFVESLTIMVFSQNLRMGRVADWVGSVTKWGGGGGGGGMAASPQALTVCTMRSRREGRQS